MAKIIDLSMPIKPHWRWRTELIRRKAHERGDMFQASEFTISCHGYTHVDAPVHFVPGGKSLDEIPLEAWIGEAVVVDLVHIGPEEAITAAELEEHGQSVRGGDFVLLRTAWDARCDWETREFWSRAPYLVRDGAEWLVGRSVSGVGFDFPSDYAVRDEVLSPGRRRRREEWAVHDVFLPRDVRVVEYLVNLGAITRERVQLFIAPLKLEGADGAPARVFALEG